MSEAKWELVATFMERLSVPGGWIYRSYNPETTSIAFVPDPAVWAHPDQHGNLTGWCQYRKTLPNEWVSG